jgi:heat shock protein HtpX
MNFMRTFTLLAAMTALFVLIGLVLGGRGGMMIALVFAVGTNLFAWFNSDRLALSAVDAREVDSRSAPDLVADVAMLAGRAGLPTPRVLVVASPQPNAFATGRDPRHSAIAVNEGLLHVLSREERLGVLAHEMAHIHNRDTLTMTITATLAGAISAVAHWGFFAGRRRGGWLQSLALSILAPMAAAIVQMAVSRGREYEADRFGGRLCGNPLWLASALRRLTDHAVPDEAMEAYPAMAAMCIVNPLFGGGTDNLFSTHPAMENRIAALMEQAREMGLAAASWTPSAPDTAAPAKGARWRPFRDAGASSNPQSTFLGGRGVAAGPPARGPWGQSR